MRRARYDQRVQALIEVRGGERDWQEAERVFEEHGWPVIGHEPDADDPATRRMYSVEVRLYGAASRAAVGAAWRVEQAAKAARVEMYTRRAKLMARDLRSYPAWWVFSTAGRQLPMRRGGRLGVTAGLRDTGVLVVGLPRAALRMARSDGRTDVAVRPTSGPWRERSVWGRTKALPILLFMACVTLLALVTWMGSQYPEHKRGWDIAFLVVLGVCMWPASAFYRYGNPSHRSAAAITTAGGFLLLGLTLLKQDDGFVWANILTVPLAMVAIYGLWLLVRQWTWGEWVTWAVPLVVSVAVTSVVGAGSVLHALYAKALGMSADDLDVPGYWQAASALKLLTYLSLMLLAPAVWGIAKHFHCVRSGEQFNGVLYVVLLGVILLGVGKLAWSSASSAAEATAAAAAKGEQPPSYFGVEPEWTCVELAVPPAELPGEGGRIHPYRPYLAFGVAGGDAVLWDARTGKPLKVPAGKVRLVPAKSAGERCPITAPT